MDASEAACSSGAGGMDLQSTNRSASRPSTAATRVGSRKLSSDSVRSLAARPQTAANNAFRGLAQEKKSKPWPALLSAKHRREKLPGSDSVPQDTMRMNGAATTSNQSTGDAKIARCVMDIQRVRCGAEKG